MHHDISLLPPAPSGPDTGSLWSGGGAALVAAESQPGEAWLAL